jgi:hypothetical protein
MTDKADRLQPTALVRPYVLAPPADPGPLPDVLEPRSPSVVLVVGPHTAVDVTSNIGNTGVTGLTVTRGETSVTVALPPPTVDALRDALAEAAPSPYLPTAPAAPEPARGGDPR